MLVLYFEAWRDMKINWRIIRRWALGEASEEEEREVEEWGEAGEENRSFLEDVCRYYSEGAMVENLSPESVKRVWRSLTPYRQMRRRRMWQTGLVAASVILGVGMFWKDYFFPVEETETTFSRTLPVRLITSDGIQHDLDGGMWKDSLKFGCEHEVPGALSVGAVTHTKGMPERFNEIIVPRYGEYQLVLSDGTRIYLNAESSLRFPDAFGNERKVYLTGEAYFEVARDSLRPFLVEFGRTCVKVLGTQFNVKAYPERASFTTLVSGRVKIQCDNRVLQLEPGQQCEVREEEMLLRDADLTAVLAWKSGEFIFKNVALEMIMNELARWYDAEVDYETEDLKEMRFYLYVGRSENLEEVMRKMALTNQVNYRISGKKITIQR